ncbi:MAG: hypothetical protein OXG03_03345 [Gammaproteobacteria bacterium]|nr:hypothetical protein [Gammaproteobacteria bacterium]
MNPSAKKSEAAPDSPMRTAPLPPKFDRLSVMNALRAAAFSEDQATVLVETLGEAHLCLATKDDLDQAFSTLRSDIKTSETGIRRDMEKMETGIRHDMEKMEAGIRHDMLEMKSDLRGEIQGLRGEMEARFNKLSWQIMASTGGATIAGTSILGLLILFK